MASGEMLLLQKALWEASANVYERELAECEQDAKCSRRHYAKMRKILGVTVLPATSRKMQIKRRIIAALVAAVLLLTGCTTYAYREEIRAIIETIFDNHVEVKYNDKEQSTSADTIDKYYILGYVPDGYELTKTYEQPSQCKYKWENAEGAYIFLEQYHVDSVLAGMDDISKNWEIVQVGDRKIYYRFSGAHCYFWNDGIYAYQLITSAQWEEQEVCDMIENIQVKE